MKHKFTTIFLLSLGLVTILAFGLARPAAAFETGAGDIVTVDEGQVIADDYYVGARDFILNGTVEGDLIAFGSTVLIGSTGVVEGDLIAAGQSVIIEGEVQDDARIAGAVLTLGPNGRIGSDLVAASGSLETRSGSIIGGDVLYGGGQFLLAGDIAGDVQTGVGGLSLQGSVGGNVNVSVGTSADAQPVNPFMYMPNAPAVPPVRGGLTIGPEAQIGGDLEYTSLQSANVPDGAVAGELTHIVPEAAPGQVTPQAEAASARFFRWFMDNLRNLLGLLVLGLLAVWLLPRIVTNSAESLRSKPLAGFGWGLLAFVTGIVAILALIVIVILLGVFLGIITLGNLVGSTIWFGLLAIGLACFAFLVAVSYLSKIVVSYLAGKFILSRVQPSWAEKPYLPFILGVVIFAILVAIPILGGLINFLVVIAGLGALWLLGMEWLRNRKSEPAPAVAE
jgi:cytoskeletal protein CcmA (bactofilin family)